MSKLNTFIRFPLAAAMLAAMGSLSTGCQAGSRGEDEGEVVAIERVPEAARATIEANAGGQAINEVTTFEEDGEQMYIGRTIKDGRATGIEVFSTGQVSSIETQLRPEELPALVKRAADAETLGYPQRVFWKKDHQKDGAEAGVTYVVNAASRVRSKHVELNGAGKVLRSSFTSN